MVWRCSMLLVAVNDGVRCFIDHQLYNICYSFRLNKGTLRLVCTLLHSCACSNAVAQVLVRRD